MILRYTNFIYLSIHVFEIALKFGSPRTNFATRPATWRIC